MIQIEQASTGLFDTGTISTMEDIKKYAECPQKVLTWCDYCGHPTYKERAFNQQTQKAGGQHIRHTIYRCEICQDVYLLKTNNPGENQKIELLWPSYTTLSAETPERVRELYREALSVRRSPSSFVVQIGRALEALVKDKGAQGKTLNDRLNWLISQGELPTVFGEMAHINRILRNWGSHDSDFELTEEDVEIVDEFFKTIVEYVYVAPAKVDRVNELLEDRKNKDNSVG